MVDEELDALAKMAGDIYRQQTGHGNLIGAVEGEIRRVLPAIMEAARVPQMVAALETIREYGDYKDSLIAAAALRGGGEDE